MPNSSTANILLVEDDDVAAEAVRRAFRRAEIRNPMFRVTDGIKALDVLRGTAGVEPIPRPYLILLDLRMPRMDGLKFLEALRADPELESSVVFVLTTSDSEQDRAAAYESHVAGYIVKDRVGENFSNLVNMLVNYWTIVELPEG